MKKLIIFLTLLITVQVSANSKEYDLTCKEAGRLSSKPISFIFEENLNNIYVRRVTKDKIFNPSLASELEKKSKITWIIIGERADGEASIYKFNLNINKKNMIVFQAILENSEFDKVKKYFLKKKKKIISEDQYNIFREDIFSQTKYKLRDVVTKCTGTIFKRN